MKFGASTLPLTSAERANRRLIGGLLVSLLLHGGILLLQFGVPGLGSPSAPPPLTVTLASSPSPPLPPLPLPPTPLPPPVAAPPLVTPPLAPQPPLPLPKEPKSFQMVEPVAEPAPEAAPKPTRAKRAVKKGTPRKAKRISPPMPATDLSAEATQVVSQDANANDFVVPLARPEEAEQKTVDIKQAQEGENEGDAIDTAALEAEAARVGKIKAEEEAERVRLAEQAEREEQAAQADIDRLKAAELAEQQRLAQQKIEQERVEQQRVQQSEQEAARLREQQLALQKIEQQKADEQRLARQLEEQQKAEQLKEAQARETQRRVELEKVEQQRLEQQKAEQLRAEQQRAEQQRAEQRRAEQQRAEQQRAEQQRAEQQRAEQQRAEQQRAEQQRAEQQRAEQQRAEQQRAEQQRAEQQRAEQQRAEQQRAEQQRADQQRAADEAAAQRGRDLANARAGTQPGTQAGGQPGTAGGAGPGGAPGGAKIPRDMMGSDLGSRARELVKGLDLLKGAPPTTRMPGDRRVAVGASERDLPLKMYAESWRGKIERNGLINYPRSWADETRIEPLVSVAVRSDGTVEDVTIIISSGRSDMDEAVRRIVRVNARYAPFPPAIAARYDVIEIRRVWRFGETLKLMEEVR
jgi:TonB family protein